MEYLIGLWLVGAVITSLYVVARLRGEVYDNKKEIAGTVVCVVLVSIFWFWSMPFLAYSLNKLKKKNIRNLLDEARRQDERKW